MRISKIIYSFGSGKADIEQTKSMANYSTYTEQELILLLKERDKLAFTEIYNRHWHVLYFHTFKVLGNTAEAKDLLQDFFFAFWEKSADLDIKTNLKGYMYAAVRNRIISLIRKQKVNPDFVDLIISEIDEADNATVERIDEKELVRLIDAEIERLPKKMKKVFEMSRKEFLSHKEIADQLGMSEDAVRKQVHRSIRILKLKLGNYAGVSIALLSILK